MNESQLEIGFGTAKGADSRLAGEQAARQAVAMIHRCPMVAVMVHASVHFELPRVLQGIRGVLPDLPLLGCTTAGEICNGSLEESVVVTVLASPAMQVSIGLGRQVAKDWAQAVEDAIRGPEVRRYFDDPAYWREMTLKGKSAFGILLSPGNTRHSPSFSFEILEAIKQKSLGRLPIFGGSAADDWRMDSNQVFSGNTVYPDTLLLAVFETQLQFGIAMDHGFVPTLHKTTVTRAEGHEVVELDGGPAADRYALMVGSSRAALEGKHLTLTTGHTMGTSNAMGQASINVASFFTARGGITLTQPVTVGTELTLMEPGSEEVPTAGREALRKALLRGNITQPGLSMVAYCALRPRILGEKAQKEIALMVASSPGVPLVGFKSFGEQGLADDGSFHHNNAVVSVLVLGKDLSPVARVADENEILRETLARQNEELETRVRERTARLSTVNEQLQVEINERRLAEESLKLSNSRFQTLADASFEGILISEEGRITDMNTRLGKILGYEPSELIGTPMADLLPQEVRDGVLASVFAGTECHVEHEMLRKDGSRMTLEARGMNLEQNGRGLRITVIRDITERLQAAEQNLRLQNQFQHAHKMESLGRLAGGVAHDMNNVLGAILALASTHLAHLSADQPLRPSLETIRDAAVRGGDLVKRLLAFSRQTPTERHELNLNALLLEEARLLERTTLARVQLELDLAPDLRPILGDGSAIAHALMNLCVNAVDAMNDGGTLTFRSRNLGPDQVQVTVADNGSGMTRDVLDRAMDPFFTTKAIGKGTGLGLALVFTTVTAHGGHLGLDSEPGHGTRVTLTFPAVEAQPPQALPEAALRPDPAGPVLQVLLVDDDDLIQRSTRMMAESLGHTVLTAASGEAALELLAQGFQPDAVILDVNMPGLGGQGTLPRLRSLNPTVPVLLATGRADQEALDLVASHPFVTLLPKPYTFEDLRDRLDEIPARRP